jgi:hypothetical protein
MRSVSVLGVVVLLAAMSFAASNSKIRITVEISGVGRFVVPVPRNGTVGNVLVPEINRLVYVFDG